MTEKRDEIPGTHHDADGTDERPGPYGDGEETAGSGRGPSTDGANLIEEAPEPSDPSRGA